MGNKPRIKYNSFARMWVCWLTNSVGWTVSGYGFTPFDAYQKFLRVSRQPKSSKPNLAQPFRALKMSSLGVQSLHDTLYS